jgi:hypothetical protein
MSLGIVDLANPGVPIVMLDLAHLCQDCTAIAQAPNGICMRCGSRSLLSMGNILNRVEQPKWVCFHCGFETSDEAEAEAHFGDRDDGEEFKPLCRWWQRMTPVERGQALQDTIQQLNDERRGNSSLRVSNWGLEYQVAAHEGAIRSYRPFKDCRRINDVFFLYDSMEGRALAAEQRLNAFLHPEATSLTISRIRKAAKDARRRPRAKDPG